MWTRSLRILQRMPQHTRQENLLLPRADGRASRSRSRKQTPTASRQPLSILLTLRSSPRRVPTGGQGEQLWVAVRKRTMQRSPVHLGSAPIGHAPSRA